MSNSGVKSSSSRRVLRKQQVATAERRQMATSGSLRSELVKWGLCVTLFVLWVDTWP